MSYQLLGYAKNKIAVVFDPVGSHAATHFVDTPQLKALVQEIIAGKELTGESQWFEVDMGRVVGETSLVLTYETDDIIYAKRLNREGYTRFTKSRQPQPCRMVAVALNPLESGKYELTSAWIGSKGYPFPDEPAATPESRDYWACRALVWGTQEVQPGTETNACPW